MPDAAQVSSVCGPMHGMSNRRSWFSLATLTAHGTAVRPGQFTAPRQAFVRALQTPPPPAPCCVFTTTNLADFQPRYFPGDAVTEGDIGLLFRGCFWPQAEITRRHQGASATGGFDQFLTPSRCNSPAIAPKMVCALRSLQFEQQGHGPQIEPAGRKDFWARCGRSSRIGPLRAPVNAEISFDETGPPLSQTMSSTRSGQLPGRFRFSNATATSRFTPMLRAWRAKISGNDRFPAMIPKASNIGHRSAFFAPKIRNIPPQIPARFAKIL